MYWSSVFYITTFPSIHLKQLDTSKLPFYVVLSKIKHLFNTSHCVNHIVHKHDSLSSPTVDSDWLSGLSVFYMIVDVRSAWKQLMSLLKFVVWTKVFQFCDYCFSILRSVRLVKFVLPSLFIKSKLCPDVFENSCGLCLLSLRWCLPPCAVPPNI